MLPDEVPPKGIDLKAYYHDNGSYVWSLFAGAAGLGTATRLVTDIQSGAAALPLLILAGVAPVLWLSRSLGYDE